MNKHDAIKHAFGEVIDALGYDRAGSHFENTPDRVARFYTGWITTGDPGALTKFDAEDYDEIVLTGAINFHSMCAHHVLPFFGQAVVGYLPGKQIVGLSKLARVVDHYAHRLQTQEQLGRNIATFLMDELQPRGLGVILRAEHLCMSLRGVSKPGHYTVTSVMKGAFRESAAARAEFLGLAQGVK